MRLIAAGVEKDTDTDSLSICAQQSLHLLFHVRRFNVLPERKKEIRLHAALAACLSLTYSVFLSHAHTHKGSSWLHARKHISD